MNPLTPFKNAAATLGTLGKDVSEIASAPGRLAKHQLAAFHDVLHLDFKGAALNELKAVTQPVATQQSLSRNHLDLVKTWIGNFF
jgi:hypothetical protein